MAAGALATASAGLIAARPAPAQSVPAPDDPDLIQRTAARPPAADVTMPVGDVPGAVADGSPASAARNRRAIEAHLATGRHLFFPGNAEGRAYCIESIQVPVASHGGQTLFGEGASRTRLQHVGGGYALTFGDGGAVDTRFQSIEHMELIGHPGSQGGVRFNHTRWCSIRSCDVRGFTGTGVAAVRAEADSANYFNVVEDVQFTFNRRHVELGGNPQGIGANSNHIVRGHFSQALEVAVLIGGGDTNRLHMCEFTDDTPVAVKVTGTALYNRIESCMFDAPPKAWEIAASAIDTHLLWNTGSAESIAASSDAGAGTVRRDLWTNRAAAVLSRSNAQAIPDTAIVALEFDHELHDPGGMRGDTGSVIDHLRIPLTGLYRISAHVDWAPNPNGERLLRITRNGVTPILVQDTRPAAPASVTSQGVSCLVRLTAGDTLHARVYQTSTTTLRVEGGGTPSPQFSVELVR